MKMLEEEVRIENRKKLVQRAILGSLAVGGVLAMDAVAPNSLQLLGLLGLGNKRRIFRSSIYRSRDALLDKKYIEFIETTDGKKLRITRLGKGYLKELEGKRYVFNRPKKWDGKFRMLSFDIKETRRKTRDQLRFALKQIGFYQLQKSVWVFPYDCEELVTLLKADFKIGKDVLYIRPLSKVPVPL